MKPEFGKYLLNIWMLVLLSLAAISFDSRASENMHITSFGTSWFDTTGQFRFRTANNLDGFVIFNGHENRLSTITFWDQSFVVINLDTEEVARYNSSNEHISYTTLGSYEVWDASASVQHTLTAYLQHIDQINSFPPEPDCPVILPPGEPCPIDIGINSFPALTDFKSPFSEVSQSSQSSAWCQFMETKRDVPYNGFSTLDRCSRNTRYAHNIAVASAVATCSVVAPTLGASAALCAVASATSAYTLLELDDAKASCMQGFRDVELAMDLCDSEELSEEGSTGGGNIAPGVNVDYTSNNPALDLFMSQTVTCRIGRASIPGEGPGNPQQFCFIHL